MTSTNFESPEEQRDHREQMLKSAFVSAFWAVIDARRHQGLKLVDLAGRLGKDKSALSRWFSGPTPNWSVKTISDLANALDVEVEITLRDRKTGEIFTPTGKMAPAEGKVSPREAA